PFAGEVSAKLTEGAPATSANPSHLTRANPFLFR
ncbi:hypothetical protein MNBD_ALPHA05-211, partial [hydrothermal vent metagenome]